MLQYDSLYKSLYDLFLRIQEKILIDKANGNFVKIPYEEINAVNLDFHLGNFQYDWQNVRYYEVYDWKSNVFADFLEKYVKMLPEYESAVKEICTLFGVPEHAKHIGIYHFVTYIMHRIPNNGVNDDNIKGIIRTFIKDFETLKDKQLYTWDVQIWLCKFEFEGEAISISDNAIIRKPRQEDLVLRRPIRNYPDEFEKITGRGFPASSILEFTMKAPVQHMGLYSDSIREEIEKWIDIFRLFKVANVYPVFQSIYPDSILEGGTTENPKPPFDEGWEYKIDIGDKSSYGCLIKKDEIPLLIDFSHRFKPILNNISLKTYLKTGNYLHLAVHRYKDSLLKSNIHVDRIVSAIGSLEALLSNSPGEISYRISIYVAAILQFLGFNSLKVYEKVKTAYTIRSQLVHGNKLSGGKKDLLLFARKHTHEIVNYARLCLLISLQLKDKISKDEFIKKLNYSLVDNSTSKELCDLIKKNVSIPVIYPFLKELNPEGDEIY